MILIERPCCTAPMAIELPIPDSLRCDDCATTWDVVDAVAEEALLAARPAASAGPRSPQP